QPWQAAKEWSSFRSATDPLAPAPERDSRPDELDDADRPRALQESVRRRGQTRARKQQYVHGSAVLERVEHEHGRHDDDAEQRQRAHQAWTPGASWPVRS